MWSFLRMCHLNMNFLVLPCSLVISECIMHVMPCAVLEGKNIFSPVPISSNTLKSGPFFFCFYHLLPRTSALSQLILETLLVHWVFCLAGLLGATGMTHKLSDDFTLQACTSATILSLSKVRYLLYWDAIKLDCFYSSDIQGYEDLRKQYCHILVVEVFIGTIWKLHTQSLKTLYLLSWHSPVPQPL